jgi:hypothetical protein
VAAAVFVATGAYFWNFVPVARHPALIFPWHPYYWRYLTNLVSLGFAIEGLSVGAGVFCLCLVFAPLAYGLRQPRLRVSSGYWGVVALAVATVAALATITIGRAGFGVALSKSSRYAEVGQLLVPAAALAWALVLADRPAFMKSALSVLWVVCAYALHDDWDASVYREHLSEQQAAVRCIRRYYREGGDGLCPVAYPRPLHECLEYAKVLRPSFYQELAPLHALSRQDTKR